MWFKGEDGQEKKELLMSDQNNTFDKTLIRDLALLLDETNLSEIELEQKDFRVRVARQVTINASVPAAAPVAAPAPAAAPAAAAPAAAQDITKHPGLVASPMVGTAYLAAEPGAANFVKVGDKVTAGQTIAIIEAMKTMNQIPAPHAGTVTQIIIGDAQPVEFGEPLMIIE